LASFKLVAHAIHISSAREWPFVRVDCAALVGGTETLKVDVRVVSATNRNLEALMADGKFREDLYYRLNVFPIHMPALRDMLEPSESRKMALSFELVRLPGTHFLERPRHPRGSARRLDREPHRPPARERLSARDSLAEHHAQALNDPAASPDGDALTRGDP
jgi:hypothetical protein